VADVTELLRAANAGDRASADRLFSLLYDELKALARRTLQRNARLFELDTTMLVHESFLKLMQVERFTPADRLTFYSYVGKVMRSVVLDAVREQQAKKRGGDYDFVELTTGVAERALRDDDLLALDDALNTLAGVAPELKDLVELRYFAGLTIGQVSQLSGRSVRSIERDWEKARLLLRQLIAER
jgi:RNA polymerase sigma factor (TIGR02999 family)